jgi:hypothetical protein
MKICHSIRKGGFAQLGKHGLTCIKACLMYQWDRMRKGPASALQFLYLEFYKAKGKWDPLCPLMRSPGQKLGSFGFAHSNNAAGRTHTRMKPNFCAVRCYSRSTFQSHSWLAIIRMQWPTQLARYDFRMLDQITAPCQSALGDIKMDLRITTRSPKSVIVSSMWRMPTPTNTQRDKPGEDGARVTQYKASPAVIGVVRQTTGVHPVIRA